MGPRVAEVRVGRNYVRAGDVVHVKPSRPRRRDGGDARVEYIELTEAGEVDHYGVWLNGQYRALRAERIVRRQQTRAGVKVGRR